MAYDSIIQALLAPTRKLFVSYHHGGDRSYYDEFSRIFHDTYEACQDNSVDRLIDSSNSEYVIRRIREEYIVGTSCTIVLCGAETRWRKFVDWEIKATLDKCHALIGVHLPSNPRDILGNVHVPDRLKDNIDSRYALWVGWESLIANVPAELKFWIERAKLQPSVLIRNARPLRERNGWQS